MQLKKKISRAKTLFFPVKLETTILVNTSTNRDAKFICIISANYLVLVDLDDLDEEQIVLVGFYLEIRVFLVGLNVMSLPTRF